MSLYKSDVMSASLVISVKSSLSSLSFTNLCTASELAISRAISVSSAIFVYDLCNANVYIITTKIIAKIIPRRRTSVFRPCNKLFFSASDYHFYLIYVSYILSPMPLLSGLNFYSFISLKNYLVLAK